MNAKSRKSRRVRLAVQILFLVVIAAIAINHTLAESGNEIPLIGTPSLHAVCPFGGVVSLYQFTTTGTLTRKIHESSLILMWIVFGLAVALGPVFCGWVCPMGTVQELISKIGRRILGKRHNTLIPARLDRVLRYLRYAVLAWVIWVTARSGQLIFADYDPYYALFNFWSGEVAISGLVILGLVLGLSLIVERPFCKYACPYGAVLGIFNFARLFPIRRNQSTCIDCGACDRSCPMNITVSTATAVRDSQCISCLRCTSDDACPVAGTVQLQAVKFAAPVKETVQ